MNAEEPVQQECASMVSQTLEMVAPVRLTDSVIRQLTQRIVRGDFSTGASLPRLESLADSMGVSRTVIREAVKVLEEKGLVQMLHGRGTVVQERSRWNIIDPEVLTALMASEEAEPLFEQLSRVRIALESEMAEQAALLITQDDLTALAQLLASGERELSIPDRYIEYDVAFHDRIMMASGNRIAQSILASIHEPLIQSRRITNQIPNGVLKAHEFHTLVYCRLAERNPEGARIAMREHLVWSLQAFRCFLNGGPEICWDGRNSGNCQK